MGHCIQRRTTILLVVLFGAMLFVPWVAWGGARIEIEGITGDLLKNVHLHVGTPATDDPRIVRRFARRIPDLATEALAALGYYEPDIEVRSKRDGEEWVLRLIVDPGEPVRIHSLQVCLDGDAAQDEEFQDVLKRLPLQEGDRLHHGRYAAIIRMIENTGLARGYFEGRFTDRRIVIDRQAYRADVFVCYDSGPRYRMGEVRFPETPLRETLLQRLVPFEMGVPYHVGHITRLNRNLLNSAYFRDVRVRPQPDAAGAAYDVPVDADVTMGDPNIAGIGVGMTTDVGPRLRLSWRRPWVNRRGHSLGTEAELSEVRQNVSAQYTVPLNPPLDHRLQLLYGWQREEIKDKTSEKKTAGVQRERLLTGGWQQHLFLRWEEESFTQADVRGQSYLLLPGMWLGRRRARGGIYPDRGDKLFGSIMGAHPDLGSDISLARFKIEGKIFRSAGRHRGLIRAEYGALTTESFKQTPSSLRFFAGGDNSVRGFAYESLSPRDDEGNRIGGRYLVTGSLEYSYALSKRWRAATFLDVGNAAADIGFEDGLEMGTGVGIRWRTPVGPLRADLACGISDPNRPIRLHLSMGTEI